MVTLIKGDCMDLMKDTPDKFFSLAIVDVPYGIGMMSADNLSRGKKAKAKNYHKILDSDPPNKEYFNELFRISKNQIIWGANHFIDLIPFRSPCWIVWDKNNATNDFADCELAWTSFNTAVRKFTFTWNGMIQGDMKNKELRIHITQKPVQLYKYILKNYAKIGDTILDTHGGSFSSVVACIDGGFDVDCCEIDSQYFEAGVKRVQNHMAQLDIFIERPEIKIIYAD